MTFRCASCQVIRDESEIETVTESRRVFAGIMDRNVNYCKDNPKCRQYAELIAKTDADKISTDIVYADPKEKLN
jgi:hypothetical protein